MSEARFDTLSSVANGREKGGSIADEQGEDGMGVFERRSSFLFLFLSSKTSRARVDFGAYFQL